MLSPCIAPDWDCGCLEMFVGVSCWHSYRPKVKGLSHGQVFQKLLLHGTSCVKRTMYHTPCEPRLNGWKLEVRADRTHRLLIGRIPRQNVSPRVLRRSAEIAARSGHSGTALQQAAIGQLRSGTRGSQGREIQLLKIYSNRSRTLSMLRSGFKRLPLRHGSARYRL